MNNNRLLRYLTTTVFITTLFMATSAKFLRDADHSKSKFDSAQVDAVTTAGKKEGEEEGKAHVARRTLFSNDGNKKYL